MIVTRAYKTELDPNQEQRKAMVRAAGVARFAYNWDTTGWRTSDSFIDFQSRGPQSRPDTTSIGNSTP